MIWSGRLREIGRTLECIDLPLDFHGFESFSKPFYLFLRVCALENRKIYYYFYSFMKNYYIITIGCQMNKSDSERVAGYLEEYGLKSTNDRKKAGIVIINTCGVRQSAEDRVYGLVPKIKKENQKVKIVITGCLALRKDVRKTFAR